MKNRHIAHLVGGTGMGIVGYGQRKGEEVTESFVKQSRHDGDSN